MSDVIQIDGDWRKAASAAQSESQSAEETEQAFMDQAYASVQSKAAPIMRAPYRLGFEIVHKNDDNTRLVGIFVFRVNKDLYYAPVFFINGSIKGTDLFYRHSAKAFVPCTERWLEYLISLSETAEGVGVPISERTNTRRQLNLTLISQPPEVMNFRKYSSATPETLAAWEGIKSAALQPAEIEQNILRTFITETGGFSSLKKIANTAKENHEFAEALFLGSKPENYAPELEPVKQAAPAAPLLTLHTNLVINQNVKSASAKDLNKGYMFDDKRDPNAVHDVVIESNLHELQAVTTPGVYDVLMADGSFSECICAYHHSLLPKHLYHSNCSRSGSEFAIPMVIVEKASNKSVDTGYLCGNQESKIVGKFKDNIKLDENLPTAGKMYRIFDSSSQGFSKPVFVKSVTAKAMGSHEVTFVHHNEFEMPTTITINPDYARIDVESKIYGRSTRWVPVKYDTEGEKDNKRYVPDHTLDFGSAATLTNFLYRQGYVRGALQKSANNDFILRLNTIVKNSPAYTFNKLASVAALMVEGNMTEADAEELVKRATEVPRVLFYYKPMEKKSYNLRFPQFPEFYDTMNSDFNVLEQPQPTHVMVQADKDTPYIEKQRVGDKMSFDGGDNMDGQTPISLYNNSKQRGVSSVFEHGVVGSLINTYDSVAMIDAYMPKLQSALDCLGRTLFLFYWKPEDFAQAFGADDQTQLENKLISNFKSFGDLVIDLLQKTKAHQEGSSSLS